MKQTPQLSPGAIYKEHEGKSSEKFKKRRRKKNLNLALYFNRLLQTVVQGRREAGRKRQSCKLSFYTLVADRK